VELLSSFIPLMTAPTYANFVVIASGWVFASGRRTVTEVIQKAGAIGKKHHSAFHGFFSYAQWSIDQVSHVLLGILLQFVSQGQIVYLALDDTLCRKRGLHIFGTRLHHDPLISQRTRPLVSWGHSWVVVGILLEFPFAPGVVWCLPFAFRLYISRNRPRSQRWRGTPRHYRTRPELAVEILQQIASWYPDRQFQVACDSAYGGQSVLKRLPEKFHLTSRLPMDARLYAPPPAYGGRGRPRKKGKQLPSPQALAKDARQRWNSVRLVLYGRKKRLKIKETTGLWPSAGYQPIKVVLVRDPQGKESDHAFFTTDTTLNAVQILTIFARRWSIEVAFHNSKSYFGFQDPQNRTRKAVQRTAPMALVLYSTVIVWFAQHGYHRCTFPTRPWYRKKASAAFIDMVATLRRESLREYFLNTPGWTPATRKMLRHLMETLPLAA
jgi:hypothetical protein